MATGSGACLFHKAYPAEPAVPAKGKKNVWQGQDDKPNLVEVEEDHFVGCFDLGEGTCRVA